MAIKSKKTKHTGRDRRKLRIRKAISTFSERARLTVFKSGKHTYAQVIDDSKGVTIASASTLEADVSSLAKELSKSEDLQGRTTSTKGLAAARAVGMSVAERCLTNKVDSVVFDRNGFLYHGRIQAVADGARAKGLKF